MWPFCWACKDHLISAPTKHCGRVVSTPTSYLKGSGLKSWPRHLLPW
jgi:hypothetical protein